MDNRIFEFNIRTQYTFITDDSTLSSILGEIANQGVNINGYLQTEVSPNQVLVKLVVGSSTSESSKDLRIVKNILRMEEVRFKEKEILQFSNESGVPGQIDAIYRVLWCKVRVKAIYPGEDNLLYVEVSNLEKAIKILSQKAPKQCP